MTITLTTELAAIRDDLAELRRYVRMRPTYVQEALSGPIHALRLKSIEMGSEAHPAFWPDRIAGNLHFGRSFILACPDALDGHLAGAVWELEVMIGQLEREGASDGR